MHACMHCVNYNNYDIITLLAYYYKEHPQGHIDPKGDSLGVYMPLRMLILYDGCYLAEGASGGQG